MTSGKKDNRNQPVEFQQPNSQQGATVDAGGPPATGSGPGSQRASHHALIMAT